MPACRENHLISRDGQAAAVPRDERRLTQASRAICPGRHLPRPSSECRTAQHADRRPPDRVTTRGAGQAKLPAQGDDCLTVKVAIGAWTFAVRPLWLSFQLGQVRAYWAAGGEHGPVKDSQTLGGKPGWPWTQLQCLWAPSGGPARAAPNRYAPSRGSSPAESGTCCPARLGGRFASKSALHPAGRVLASSQRS